MRFCFDGSRGYEEGFLGANKIGNGYCSGNFDAYLQYDDVKREKTKEQEWQTEIMLA